MTDSTSASNSRPGTGIAPGPDDPRYGFAMVTSAVGQLIEGIEAMEPTMLGQNTPCPEFSVEDLLDHVLMVMRRVAVIGGGGHFSTVQHQRLGSGWLTEYRAAAHDIMTAWTDDAKLEQLFEVPWGRFPGSPILFSYIGELAVHGWDLARATGQTFEIEDGLLEGALVAAKFIPAEGRESPELPFGPVVDPGDGAPVLAQLAGWFGRHVNG